MIYTPTLPMGQPIRDFLSGLDENTLRTMIERTIGPGAQPPAVPVAPGPGDSRRNPVDLTAQRGRRRVDFEDEDIDLDRVVPQARRSQPRAQFMDDDSASEDFSDDENPRQPQPTAPVFTRQASAHS